MKFLLFSLLLTVVFGAPSTGHIFTSFDADHNGCLSNSEFTNAGSHLGLSAEQLQDWFSTSDINGDGCVDASDFGQKLMRWGSNLYSKALNRASGVQSVVVNAQTPAVGASPVNMLMCKFEDSNTNNQGLLLSKCSTCMKRQDNDLPLDGVLNLKFFNTPGAIPAYYNRDCMTNVECPSNQCIAGFQSCLPQAPGAPCANNCDCGSLHCSTASDNGVIEGTCKRSGSFCAVLCSGISGNQEAELCDVLCHHRDEASYLNGPFVTEGVITNGLPVIDALLGGYSFDANVNLTTGEPIVAAHPDGDRGSADPLPGDAYLSSLEVSEPDLEDLYSISCDVNADCSSGRCHPVWGWCMASHYGGRCENDFDCYGFQCREDKTCGKSFPGVYCNKDSECDSNHCHQHVCQASAVGEICLHDYDCWSVDAGSELLVCRKHGSHHGDGYGVCSGGVDAACRHDDQCASGECHDNKCIVSGKGGDCETDDDCGTDFYQQPSNNCPMEPLLKCVFEDGNKHRGTCRTTPCSKLSCDPNACCFSETTKCVVHQGDQCPVSGGMILEVGNTPIQISNSDTDFHAFSITFDLFPQAWSFGVVSKGVTCGVIPGTPAPTDGWGVFVDAGGYVVYQDFKDQHSSSVKVPLNRASSWSVSVRGVMLEICRTDLPKCLCNQYYVVDQYRMAADIPIVIASQDGACDEYVGPITVNLCHGGLSYQTDFVVDSRAQTEHVSDTAFCKCSDDLQGSGLLGANSNCGGGFGDTCVTGATCSSGNCDTCECAANPLGGVCGADTDCASTQMAPLACHIRRGNSAGTCAVDNCGVAAADGGCSDFATCTVRSNGRTKCECNDGYFGSGRGTHGCVTPCENNGGCGINGICLALSRYERKCRCLPGFFEDDNECVNPCLDGSNGGCPPLSECSASGAHKHECRCIFPLFSPFTQDTTLTTTNACVADLCLVPTTCKFDAVGPLKQICVFDRLTATSTCECDANDRSICLGDCVTDLCKGSPYCSPLARCSLNAATCMNECKCRDGYSGDGVGPTGCVAAKCVDAPVLTGIEHASVGTCDSTQTVGAYCELSCLPGFTVSRKPMARCAADVGLDTAHYEFETYSCVTLPATHKLRGLTGWVCDAQDACHPKAPTVGYKHEHVHYPGNQLGVHWIALGPSVTQLTLYWTQVFPTGGATQNSGPILNPGFATSYDVTGLVRGATYSFALHATTETETFISFPLTITF